MRCPRRLPKMMLAAILAVGIAFPAPALAFADDAADANKSAGESAVDTTAISEGAAQGNDPALFDELVEGVDYRGLLVTLDEDSKINLLSEDGGESELAQGLADAGLAVTNQIESADGSTLAVADVADDMRASEAVAAAQEVPGVVSVQPNFVYRLVDEVPAGALDESAASIAGEQVEGDEDISAQALGMPNDDYVYTRDPNEPYNQYWLYTTRITRAWNLVHTDNTVTVATLDTGVDFDHADLEDNLLMDYAWDAYNSKPLSASVSNGDRIGHGTMVAGIISARANNGIGLAGASFNATILPVKVFNDTGAPEATTASVLSGYKYVIDLATSKTVPNLRVVNASFGSYNTYSSSGYCLKDEALRKAIVSAKNAGIVTVCSGGNGKDGKPRTDNIYPADFDECVAVTALNTDNTNCYWSDYNKKKNISAPGLLVTTTDATGGLLQGQRHLDGGADCLGCFRTPVRRRARRHGRRRLQGDIPHSNPHPGSGKRPHENKRQQGSHRRREGRQSPLGARQNRISRCVPRRLVLRRRILHEGARRYDRRRRDGHVRPPRAHDSRDDCRGNLQGQRAERYRTHL